MSRSLLLLLLPLSLFAARDWVKAPAIAQFDAPENIYAVGDVHGDYQRLLKLLRTTHLIGKRNAWTGGKSVLVLTGDMIDKGPQPVNVIRFLIGLQHEASQTGGRVVVTMGNHEAEFLASPDPVKAKDFIRDLNKHHLQPVDISKCETDIGQFFCSLPVGARVSDWFFSHGGNTGGRTIAKLEADVEAGVDKDGYGTQVLMNANSILESRLGADKSWLTLDKTKNEKDLLTAYVKALGVEHLAQGHQPSEVTFDGGVVRHPGEMFQAYGLLFLNDVGLSRGVNDSVGAVLRIERSGSVRATAVCAGGLETPVWDSGSRPAVGRVSPCR